MPDSEQDIKRDSSDVSGKKSYNMPPRKKTYIGVGIALGAAIGSVFDNIAIGIAVGIAVGAAIGASSDNR